MGEALGCIVEVSSFFVFFSFLFSKSKNENGQALGLSSAFVAGKNAKCGDRVEEGFSSTLESSIIHHLISCFEFEAISSYMPT